MRFALTAVALSLTLLSNSSTALVPPTQRIRSCPRLGAKTDTDRSPRPSSCTASVSMAATASSSGPAAAAAKAAAGGVTSIVWFRKALRLHDNRALLDACGLLSGGGGAAGAAAPAVAAVAPVYLLDARFADPARVGAVRYRFLLEARSYFCLSTPPADDVVFTTDSR